jgi:nucleoside-diphosphate-sugar epimerase
MKRVLVCGAGGFVGNHLVRRLKDEGCWVRGVDLRHPEFSLSRADDFLVGDLRQPRTCAAAVDHRFDEVYQLAADTGGAGYVLAGENGANLMHGSALVNLNMLEACHRQGVRRVFYASSAAEPDGDYGAEKLFSERLYLAFHRNYGTPVRIGRLHNVFGPESCWTGGRERAPAALCRKVAEARDGGEVEVWGDGRQTRAFLYIDECLEAMLRLVRSDWTGPADIASGEPVSLNSLARLIIDVAGKPLAIRNVPGPEGVRSRAPDSQRVERMLGWRASAPLRDGIARTYDWVAERVHAAAREPGLPELPWLKPVLNTVTSTTRTATWPSSK